MSRFQILVRTETGGGPEGPLLLSAIGRRHSLRPIVKSVTLVFISGGESID